MRFQSLRSKINELQEITNTWQESTPVSQLEMDMALDRVKQIYELLRFESVTVDATAADNTEPTESIAEPDSLVAAVEEVAEQIVEATVGLIEMIDDATEESAEEIIEESVETIVEEESAALATEAVKLNKRERYNRILSLYGEDVDSATTAPTSEPEPDPEPISEPIVEPIVEQPSTAPTQQIAEQPAKELITESEPRSSMSIQLTLNDRFLLSHDLFDDDMDALNLALAQLDGQPSYDDAIIFIAENFAWDGNSAGAQIMITLLKNRFSLN